MSKIFDDMSTVILEAHGPSIKMQITGPRPACLASLSCIFKVLIEKDVFTPSELIGSVVTAAMYEAPQDEAGDIIAQVLKDLKNK
jgi:hypothetical protein